jgi:hypothetical protein
MNITPELFIELQPYNAALCGKFGAQRKTFPKAAPKFLN